MVLVGRLVRTEPHVAVGPVEPGRSELVLERVEQPLERLAHRRRVALLVGQPPGPGVLCPQLLVEVEGVGGDAVEAGHVAHSGTRAGAGFAVGEGSPSVRRRGCSYKSRARSNGVRFAPHLVRARRCCLWPCPPLDPGGLMASSFRRFVGRVAVGALAVAVPVVMTPLAASAATPTDLFFSEYVEGTSNNKALEVYNGTGADVDLAAGGYNIQGFANGASTAGTTIALTGSIAAGDVKVIVNTSAGAHAARAGRPDERFGELQRRRRRGAAQGHHRARRHRSGRVRPRHHVGNRHHQHARPHAAPARRRVRGRPRRQRRLRPGRGVGRASPSTPSTVSAPTPPSAAPSRRPTRPRPWCPSPRPTAPRRRRTVSPTVTFSEPVALGCRVAHPPVLDQRLGGLLGHRWPDDVHRRCLRRTSSPATRARSSCRRRACATSTTTTRRTPWPTRRPRLVHGRRHVHRQLHPHPADPGLGRQRRDARHPDHPWRRRR